MPESFTIPNYFKWIFSLVCFVLIVLHSIFPDIVIDSTTLGLLLLLLTPHILHLFKKIGLPGGTEIEMKDTLGKDVEELKEKAEIQPMPINIDETEQPITPSIENSTVDFFYNISDPSIAIAAFRIDLERKIRKLANLRGIKFVNVNNTLKALISFDDVDEFTSWFIRELYSLSNRAVHGESINADEASYIIEKGELVIKYLEKNISLLELNQ